MNAPRDAATRVLVTGGAGFIGSHVVEELLRRGAIVTVLDDLSSGSRTNLPADPRVTLRVGDVGTPADVAAALRGCQRVVHLAAIASVQRSVEDPEGTHRVNFRATQALGEAAREMGVERIVYASSASVYGDAAALPVDETAPAEPQTPYARDKLDGERALHASAAAGGPAASALRFFNVYGPRQRDDSPYSGVISLFLRRVAEGGCVTIFGDGQQTRDFVYVGDVARVVVDLTLRERAPRHPVLNVGAGRSTSVLTLLELVEACLGARASVRFEPGRPGDIRHSLAAVGRLHDELGWLPPTPLDRGIALTANGRAPVDQERTDAPRLARTSP